jgi:hypothetical protein
VNVEKFLTTLIRSRIREKYSGDRFHASCQSTARRQFYSTNAATCSELVARFNKAAGCFEMSWRAVEHGAPTGVLI